MENGFIENFLCNQCDKLHIWASGIYQWINNIRLKYENRLP